MTIPNTYVILPTEATGTMKAKGSTWVDGSLDRAHEAYRAMLSASPNSGLVTSKMLEVAALGVAEENGCRPDSIAACDSTYSGCECRAFARAALSALGLEMEG